MSEGVCVTCGKTWSDQSECECTKQKLAELQAPPPCQEGMTREEFLRHTNHMRNCGFLWLQKDFDAHDAAQRETITRLEEELKEEREMTKWWENLVRREQIGTKQTPSLRAYVEQLEARLTASEAKHKWTRERPKKAGWYWFKRNPIATPELTQFELESDGVTLYSKGIRVWAKRWDGFFQGPLTPGEE